MTKSKLPRPRIDTNAQAAKILEALARYVEVPGRRVTLERTEGGWLATLDAQTKCAGASATDALAQVSQVINFGEVQP